MIQDNKIRNLQMDHERLKFQISQMEEENHIHRQELDEMAKEQALLETAVRDLCVYLLEYHMSFIDNDPNWDNVGILELIRFARSKIDNIVQKHTEEITQLLEMIRFYQEEMRQLQNGTSEE